MTIGLPRSGLLLLILACTVRAALAQDRCVYVHCRAGIGRTEIVSDVSKTELRAAVRALGVRS